MTQFPPNPVSSLLTIVPSASSRAAQEQLCRERKTPLSQNFKLLWQDCELNYFRTKDILKTHNCMYR